MNPLTKDIFAALCKTLDYHGSSLTQELTLSKQGFDHLKRSAEAEDKYWENYNTIQAAKKVLQNNEIDTIKRTDEQLAKDMEQFQFGHIPLLPNLLKENPTYTYMGYTFNIIINQ